jgi:hypothetical protein
VVIDWQDRAPVQALAPEIRVVIVTTFGLDGYGYELVQPMRVVVGSEVLVG